MKTLDVTRDGHVLLVTMNRPEVLNAYDGRMVRELRETWRTFRDDDELRVAVLTGAGDRSFSTGLDVDDTLDSGVASPSLDEDGRVALTSRDLRVFKPIVVAVNGHCCAGGWHFVNDADVILCSENATFFDTHVDVGLSNPVEAVGLLSRLPLTEVTRMVASGRAYRLGAERARELGLVTEVVPLEELVPRALEIAHVMAQHPPEILAGSLETIWTAVEDQRARAEALGLALLMRASGRDLTAFRSGAGS
ncbi:enoyl-CoA hydratase/isomerase family protein [Actinomadura sp. GC306]|uniref:enoyl-CoA hydratase/isomerase family protein n=1 Tax=Actinomadura sp. GC306 TaxID=2530367 RepID=UPI0010474FF0|nr:enoyl-CoA hydratase/isomerase family protein [Actinomadura sp. GC306]TDC64607.1 enoyl-CoA hydratase/isomerase family protein [Actinomadura sp. GC306]